MDCCLHNKGGISMEQNSIQLSNTLWLDIISSEVIDMDKITRLNNNDSVTFTDFQPDTRGNIPDGFYETVVSLRHLDGTIEILENYHSLIKTNLKQDCTQEHVRLVQLIATDIKDGKLSIDGLELSGNPIFWSEHDLMEMFLTKDREFYWELIDKYTEGIPTQILSTPEEIENWLNDDEW